MPIEQTLSMIKPDGVQRGLIGNVIGRFEKNGLKIRAMKMLHLSLDQAQAFYAVHKERPFYNDLCKFMTSGPVVVQVLEGENAIKAYRDVMGATNPEKADEGTIRKLFALNMGENSVHGSDAPETAAQEIAQWFSGNEIVG